MTHKYKSNYDKFPLVQISEKEAIISGWEEIISKIKEEQPKTIVIECYHGVSVKLLISKLKLNFVDATVLSMTRGFRSEASMEQYLRPFLTNDRIFGRMSDLTLDAYYKDCELDKMKREWCKIRGVKIAIGVGASLLCEESDLFIYADMPRWEIQKKFRKKILGNIGASNVGEDFFLLYKRAYFCDWRACDRMKQTTFTKWDFILDTTDNENPKFLTVDNCVWHRY